MLIEAGLSDDSRTASTFFGKGTAVEEFKDAAWPTPSTSIIHI